VNNLGATMRQTPTSVAPMARGLLPQLGCARVGSFPILRCTLNMLYRGRTSEVNPFGPERKNRSYGDRLRSFDA
jgi:hypothetical protein